MILKSFEIDKINLEINKLILFYGKNEGFKNNVTEILIKKFSTVIKYDEKEIVENKTEFIESLLNKSLFDNKKLIIIRRATDKIYKILEEVSNQNIEETTILINSDSLDKKSKIRNFFEKSKTNVCLAFYPDNQKIMLDIANNFIKKNNLSISQSNLNLIISKCAEDRGQLINELNKLALFGKSGREINIGVIEKLTNVLENHDISLLVNYCLVKNRKKLVQILNENNFSNDDVVQIIRIFLNKSKKIEILSSHFKKNNNINLTISSAKPPIFWKEKKIVEEQIYKWEPQEIRNLIFKLNELELTIKKNINSSVQIMTNFMLEQTYN